MKPPPRGTDSSEKTKIGAVSCPSPATPEARRAGFGLLAPEHAGCRHLEGTDQTLTGDACAHAQRSREACRRPSRTSRRSSPTTTPSSAGAERARSTRQQKAPAAASARRVSQHASTHAPMQLESSGTAHHLLGRTLPFRDLRFWSTHSVRSIERVR